MDYKTVLAQLNEYRAIMDSHAIDTDAYQEANKAYTDLLFGNGLGMRGFAFLKENATRDLTVEDEARIIVGQANGNDLSEVIPLTAEAQLAYAIKRHRQAKNMTQIDLAKAVGMTQGQIARIENAQADTPFSKAKRLLEVVGGRLEIA